MFPILQIGPLALQVPGLVMLAGLWLGLTLSECRVRRHEENPNILYNLVFIAIIAGIFGARLSYVISFPGVFAANPRDLISINPGLLDLFGGVLIGIAAAIIYGMRKKLPLWQTLDALTPMFAVLAIALGISHLASGSAFGAPTSLPWAIYLWGASRHPTQVYEIIFTSITLLIIILIDRIYLAQMPGFTFLIFITLTSASRLFIEAFRGDSMLTYGGLRVAQIVSWVILAACLILLGIRIQQHYNKDRAIQ
jgi:phosphatidylglycerol:prolipoprotein diacylglycerol transferase